MVQRIVAIGGGGFLMEPDNPLLDRYFLQKTEKSTPKVCFIPTGRGVDGKISRMTAAQLFCWSGLEQLVGVVANVVGSRSKDLLAPNTQYPILQNYQWIDRAIASFEAMR